MGLRERRAILAIIRANIEGKTRAEKAERIYRALAKNPEIFMKSLRDDK